MCGIIGYIGTRNAVSLLISGLKNLEYRGYDSAGVAFWVDKEIKIVKCAGRVNDLEARVIKEFSSGSSFSGIAHTRWATHGVPNDINAHPHSDELKSTVLVHNGIIENFSELKKKLKDWGYKFVSDTDTEVLCHLIAEGKKRYGRIKEALQFAFSFVEGSYAVCILNKERPEEIWGVRNSSPLVVGVGESEMFLASDVPAFLEFTKDVVYLDDGQMVCIKKDGWEVYDKNSLKKIKKDVFTIVWNYEEATKGGFPHFMLKEIFEQPQVIENCTKGRIKKEGAEVVFEELEGLTPERVYIVACGTSYYAGLWSKYLFESWARLPVEVEIASEFRYRDIPFDEKKDVVIAVSQSGETADTLAAVRVAKDKGVKVIGVCNVVGSSIAREVDRIVYTYAGPEISVASTKAMTSQMIALMLMAIFWAKRRKTLDQEFETNLVQYLLDLPGFLGIHINSIRDRVKRLATKYKSFKDFLYLGRSIGYPLALEGALKLKEISYIHAEGYAAGEMKHGPIALIDKEFPTVAVVLNDDMVLKMISNIKEVISRGGDVLIFGVMCDILKRTDILKEREVMLLDLPEYPYPLSSFLVLPALQLFAYEVATSLGRDVDKPRNLAKSVTVE